MQPSTPTHSSQQQPFASPLTSPSTSLSPSASQSIKSPSASKPNHALPATDPKVEEHDGIHYVVFTYSVKGQNERYKVRIDIDKVKVSEIDEAFKKDNCLYLRANCSEDQYKGSVMNWDGNWHG
jgi:hypothetical protein